MGPYLGISLLKAISAKGFPVNGMVTYYLAIITGLVKLMTNKSYCWKVMLIHFQSNPSWEEGRVKIRQRQRWEQNQDFPTTPSFPLSLSPYLVADGDEHDHFLRLQLLLFFSGWIVINISKQMVHIIVPIQNPFRSLFQILTRIHTSPDESCTILVSSLGGKFSLPWSWKVKVFSR